MTKINTKKYKTIHSILQLRVISTEDGLKKDPRLCDFDEWSASLDFVLDFAVAVTPSTRSFLADFLFPLDIAHRKSLLLGLSSTLPLMLLSTFGSSLTSVKGLIDFPNHSKA
jgi:hypothetical protein